MVPESSPTCSSRRCFHTQKQREAEVNSSGSRRTVMKAQSCVTVVSTSQHKQEVVSYSDRAWEVSLSDITEARVELSGLLVLLSRVLGAGAWQRQQRSSCSRSRRKRTPTKA